METKKQFVLCVADGVFFIDTGQNNGVYQFTNELNRASVWEEVEFVRKRCVDLKKFCAVFNPLPMVKIITIKVLPL